MVVVNTFIAIGDPDSIDLGVYSNGEVLQNAVIGNKRHNALYVGHTVTGSDINNMVKSVP